MLDFTILKLADKCEEIIVRANINATSNEIYEQFKVVNEILDINEMKQIGADGVLTDYPDRAIKVLN